MTRQYLVTETKEEVVVERIVYTEEVGGLFAAQQNRIKIFRATKPLPPLVQNAFESISGEKML